MQIGPTIAKAIASQVHVSLANASTIAEKAVGVMHMQQQSESE